MYRNKAVWLIVLLGVLLVFGACLAEPPGQQPYPQTYFTDPSSGPPETSHYPPDVFFSITQGPMVSDSSKLDALHKVRIGVLIKRSKERCLEKWSPTANYLSYTMPGYYFTIVPLGYDDIESAVARDSVDFLLANPAFYVLLEQRYGLTRIATLKNAEEGKVVTGFGGVLIARADRQNGEATVNLKNASFAGVHPEAFGAWYDVKYELMRLGYTPEKLFSSIEWLDSNDEVVYAVRDGRVEIGAIRTGTLERMVQEGKIHLDGYRVIPLTDQEYPDYPYIYSTALYPEWPMAVLRSTDPLLAEEVSSRLLQMNPRNPAALASHSAGWTIPQNYQSVHEILMALKAPPYEHYGEVSARELWRHYWPVFLAVVLALLATLATAVYIHRLNVKLKKAVTGLEHEIIEREQAQEALRTSESRFRRIFEHAQEGICVLKQGRIMLANPGFRKLFGLDDVNLGSDSYHLTDFVDDADQGLVESRLHAKDSSPLLDQPLAFLARSKAGKRLELELGISNVEWEGQPAALGILWDVTAAHDVERKRRQAIQLAEETSRLASIGVLAAGITHEINQPLNAIRLSSEGIDLWRDQHPGEIPDFVSEMLREVSGGSERIASIIDHMRSYWQAPQPGQLDTVDLNLAVKNALALVTRQVQNHAIRIDLNLAGTPILVQGNPVQMEQIINNLVVNAIHALDEVERPVKRIRLFTGIEGKQAVIEIADNGPGLPTTIMDDLFDPFYSTRQPGKGMGLGLAIVHMFVKQYQGRITPRNLERGGAAFRLLFPLLTDHEV